MDSSWTDKPTVRADTVVIEVITREKKAIKLSPHEVVAPTDWASWKGSVSDGKPYGRIHGHEGHWVRTHEGDPESVYMRKNVYEAGLLSKQISRTLAGMAHRWDTSTARVDGLVMNQVTFDKLWRGLTDNSLHTNWPLMDFTFTHSLIHKGTVPVVIDNRWPNDKIDFIT